MPLTLKYHFLSNSSQKLKTSVFSLTVHIKPKLIRLQSGVIVNLRLDLAIGDKVDFRVEQIDSLLGK